jgi:hypothetical protein
MTRKIFIPVFVLTLALIVFFILRSSPSTPQFKEKSMTTFTKDSSLPAKLNPKSTTAHSQETADQPEEENKYPVWETNFRNSILAQAGDNPPEITITKVKSFVMQRDGVSLNVDSVIVNLKVDKKDRTTFSALIDSDTGKIIQTWNQPIYDPIDHKDNFSIKIDPRYNQ